MAYLWAWPSVNWHYRRATFAKASVLGFSGGVLPIAPVGLNAMLTDYLKSVQSKRPVDCRQGCLLHGS